MAKKKVKASPRRGSRRPAKKKRLRVVPQDKEIVNAQEAALILGISERLLLRLARSGEVPGRKLGREWRFLRSELRASLTGKSNDDLVRALNKRGVKFTVK